MTSESLAAAHARLLAEGGRVTVRALKSAAGVSTDAAAAWLRNVEPIPETPAPPDLGPAVKIVWAAAWQAAYREARKYAEDEVLGARAREAEALERADDADQRSAVAERLEAEAAAAAAAAESRAVTAETALAEARQALAAAERSARDLEKAQARAEAEADALRIILADLRQDLRASLHKPEPGSTAPR